MNSSFPIFCDERHTLDMTRWIHYHDEKHQFCSKCQHNIDVSPDDYHYIVTLCVDDDGIAYDEFIAKCFCRQCICCPSITKQTLPDEDQSFRPHHFGHRARDE